MENYSFEYLSQWRDHSHLKGVAYQPVDLACPHTGVTHCSVRNGTLFRIAVLGEGCPLLF